MSGKRNPLPKVLASRPLAHSWRLEVIEDKIRFEGKKPFFHARVKLPESVIVIAVASNGKIPLVRQFRHGARDYFWELPAGYVEEGETPLQCVKREFREEVGHELQEPKRIKSFYLQPSRSNQIVHAFMGKEGRFNPIPGDANESIVSRHFSLGQAMKLLSKRTSAMHLLALLLFESKIRSRSQRL